MRSPRRKTRSDKFPLTLHPTGQYFKKIKGRMHYFGTNKKQAVERYLEQATYLHGGQNFAQKAFNGSMTLKELCDLYLEYQHSKVLTHALSVRHHDDQIGSLSKLASHLILSDELTIFHVLNHDMVLEPVFEKVTHTYSCYYLTRFNFFIQLNYSAG